MLSINQKVFNQKWECIYKSQTFNGKKVDADCSCYCHMHGILLMKLTPDGKELTTRTDVYFEIALIVDRDDEYAMCIILTNEFYENGYKRISRELAWVGDDYPILPSETREKLMQIMQQKNLVRHGTR